MMELEGIFIYKYVVFSFMLFPEEIWCTHSKEIDLHVYGKAFS